VYLLYGKQCVSNKIMYLSVFRCRRKSVKLSEEWLSSSVKDDDRIGPIQIGIIYTYNIIILCR